MRSLGTPYNSLPPLGTNCLTSFSGSCPSVCDPTNAAYQPAQCAAEHPFPNMNYCTGALYPCPISCNTQSLYFLSTPTLCDTLPAFQQFVAPNWAEIIGVGILNAILGALAPIGIGVISTAANIIVKTVDETVQGLQDAVIETSIIAARTNADPAIIINNITQTARMGIGGTLASSIEGESVTQIENVVRDGFRLYNNARKIIGPIQDLLDNPESSITSKTRAIWRVLTRSAAEAITQFQQSVKTVTVAFNFSEQAIRNSRVIAILYQNTLSFTVSSK